MALHLGRKFRLVDISDHQLDLGNTLNDYTSEYDSIFLIYENNCHFKLVGYFKDKIISYFNDKTIPYELKSLYGLNK